MLAFPQSCLDNDGGDVVMLPFSFFPHTPSDPPGTALQNSRSDKWIRTDERRKLSYYVYLSIYFRIQGPGNAVPPSELAV